MLRKDANPDYVCTVAGREVRLTALQQAVALGGATERPFDNEYWNKHEEGLYLDVLDGMPLFASSAKYDSGTGWPSFFQALDEGRLMLAEDRSHGMVRTEVRAAGSGAHLGHLFDDGPAPTGLRYCMNSAALRFVPASRLEEEGLGDYRRLFG